MSRLPLQQRLLLQQLPSAAGERTTNKIMFALFTPDTSDQSLDRKKGKMQLQAPQFGGEEWSVAQMPRH